MECGHVRVLVAHNRYRSAVPSGENRMVDAEIAALRDTGVEVVPYLRSSDEIDDMGIRDRLSLPIRPVHSTDAVRSVERLILRHRPDIFHLHNPFPLISWSVAGVARKHSVPVVVTVHNHRHSCMRGSYHRDGHPCTLCRGLAFPWPGVQHACYRDSRLQSIPMAAAFAAHRRDQRLVDQYIALTKATASSLLGSGLVRPDQVIVRPNWVPDPGAAVTPGSGLVFVGRLSEEKGVPLLLAAWKESEFAFGRLTIIGSGTELAAAKQAAARPVNRLIATGQLEPTEVATAIRDAAAVVVPSISAEGLPLVVLEALSHGRPVITTTVAGLEDVVSPAFGWLADPTRDGLATTIRQAANSDLAARGRAARNVYEERYSPQIALQAQLNIYRQLAAAPSR